MLSIDDVKGDNARPSWRFFYEATGASPPSWNFSGKFLVGRDGSVTEASSDLEGEIKRLLAQPKA